MAIQQAFFNTPDRRTGNEQIWHELYSTLRPYIVSWVYASGVSAWRGQEQDITDDILQEAIIRTLKYSQQAQAGLSHPIHSIICFGRTVAQNYFRDLRRRELRLVRPYIQDGCDALCFTQGTEEVDPAEVALDSLTHLAWLMAVARTIAAFPEKQRTALLIDLANLMDFHDEYNPLRTAFHAAGIDLSTYQRTLPPAAAERSKHAASLSIAYKRLRGYRDLLA